MHSFLLASATATRSLQSMASFSPFWRQRTHPCLLVLFSLFFFQPPQASISPGRKQELPFSIFSFTTTSLSPTTVPHSCASFPLLLAQSLKSSFSGLRLVGLSRQHRSARFVWLLFVFVCFPVSVLQMESQSRLKWSRKSSRQSRWLDCQSSPEGEKSSCSWRGPRSISCAIHALALARNFLTRDRIDLAFQPLNVEVQFQAASLAMASNSSFSSVVSKKADFKLLEQGRGH